MAQADDKVTETAAHDESLVAYLDGELAATERAQVEQRLNENDSYRRRWSELRARQAASPGRAVQAGPAVGRPLK